jgi:hydrogenase maturation protease
VLASLELLGRAPREVVVLGVEPLTFETGMELSAPVATRVPDLVNAAVRELDAHGIRLDPRAMPVSIPA